MGRLSLLSSLHSLTVGATRFCLVQRTWPPLCARDCAGSPCLFPPSVHSHAHMCTHTHEHRHPHCQVSKPKHQLSAGKRREGTVSTMSLNMDNRRPRRQTEHADSCNSATSTAWPSCRVSPSGKSPQRYWTEAPTPSLAPLVLTPLGIGSA